MECPRGLKKNAGKPSTLLIVAKGLGGHLLFYKIPFASGADIKSTLGFVPDLIRVPVNQCEYQAQGKKLAQGISNHVGLHL